VIGFDDMLPVTEQADPPLTTVRQDIEEMGRLMARLLLRGLDRTASSAASGSGSSGSSASAGGAGEGLVGVPPSSVVLPTTLVLRASA
jgi:hypothetical protein